MARAIAATRSAGMDAGSVNSRPPISVRRSGSATGAPGGSTTTRAKPTDAGFRTRRRLRVGAKLRAGEALEFDEPGVAKMAAELEEIAKHPPPGFGG